MSTGKRLAKRSIVGTRVCVPADDGLYYPSVIQATKTQEDYKWGNQPFITRYTVKLDHNRQLREYAHVDIVGPGFQGVAGLVLRPGQKVYVTHQGREIAGIVKRHLPDIDDVLIELCLPQHKTADVSKRLEEVRLLESRKSLRLMDQDLDFAKVAEMGFSAAEVRKRNSSSGIDVPQTGRKRRPPTPVSMPVRELDPINDSDDVMDECAAALVLMRLSCSPHSPRFEGQATRRLEYGQTSPSSSGASSYGSGYCTLSESAPTSYFDSWVGSFTPPKSHSDDGIVTDESSDGDDSRSVKRRITYRCTWPRCSTVAATCSSIEEHVRAAHLGPRREGDDLSDHEEEFYYTETEEGIAEDDEDKLEEANELNNPGPAVQIFPVGFTFNNSPPPTSPPHQELSRLPSDDLEYHGPWKAARPISIPARVRSISWSSGVGSYSPKQMKLARSGPSPKASPIRRPRGEAKKCRKVYGMEHREMWCTQCKWKKACTRFGD